jgi:hypothetical protein
VSVTVSVAVDIGIAVLSSVSITAGASLSIDDNSTGACTNVGNIACGIVGASIGETDLIKGIAVLDTGLGEVTEREDSSI